MHFGCNVMEHPKIEDIYKNIVHWIEKNFVKAILQFHVDKDSYKFGRVSKISKVWKENGYWVVDADIEYGLRQGHKMKTVTFQINSEGKIVGYNLHEARIIGT